ncbi:DUF4270 domain-containing protein [Salinimicrobium flavum]|uniref:DUF4270 domain-containing protein n=2 Tax=Salinimicrobium flavum TaxID=1737065 RepID=A0ABW5IWJ6_9FLAO
MLKITTVIAVVFSFLACEDDFETIGGSVIGEPGFNADLYDEAEVSATTYKLPPVQTNNLPANLLGVFNDPVFGKQTANILSQVSLSLPDPDFGTEPVLDSVVLRIPYFSREVETEDNETTVYALDSIYGNSPIKLSIQETIFFLNAFDPETNFQQAQKYYSNLGDQIQNNLTSGVLYENNSFLPSSEGIVEYITNAEGEADTLNLPPALKIQLSKQFFQTKILDKAGSAELSSVNNFRNYFRSIYINAEQVGDDGVMMLLNFNEGAGITLYYTSKKPDVGDEDEDEDTEELVEVQSQYRLPLGPAKVNTFEQDVPDFSNEENLFLKGGEGSMAIIDLFSGPDSDGDGVSDELEALRENNWLINEANLEFFVNRDHTANLAEPERLYIYDINNNVFLKDYRLDMPGQVNEMTSTSNNRHLAPLTRTEDGRGVSYKIRVTDHINNILNKDSTNVRLGLVVSQNVNLVTNSAVLQSGNGEAEVTRVPSNSVITPEATVLYGPEAEDEEKRLKLKIYYTEPKN